MILNMVGGGSAAGSGFPEFTYTGSSQLIDDGKVGGKQNWRLKLLTSGTLTFKKSPGSIDVFVVGGGGGPALHNSRGGGGGGYTRTEKGVTLNIGNGYSVVIGSGGGYGVNGGVTSAFGILANGGYYGGYGDNSWCEGGSGGSGGGAGSYGVGADPGGAGGSDGGNGVGANASNNSFHGGTGQGTTTREFGEPSGVLYAGGGGGSNSNTFIGGKGGEGGGGSGGGQGGSGVENTGGGSGNGENYQFLHGGSGIVVIRNHRG